MSAWAKPGAKCVCVDDVWETDYPASRSTPNPVKGQVYIIDEVVKGGVWVGLVGFHHDYFETSGFRPLITRTEEQDVAAFRHLLNDAPVLEPTS